MLKLKKTLKRNYQSVKITYEDKGREIARASLFILRNQLHKEPFGFLEDVFVNEKYRNQGLGSKLILACIAEARKRKCYKLIATSRNAKPKLRKFYKRLGLNVWGVELRIDFKNK